MTAGRLGLPVGAFAAERHSAARADLETALDEALGRGRRTRPDEELREVVVDLARRVRLALQDHVAIRGECPHCTRCPSLFGDLMAAQDACTDIITALDALERLVRFVRFKGNQEACVC
jgi:hypothetical protein